MNFDRTYAILSYIYANLEKIMKSDRAYVIVSYISTSEKKNIMRSDRTYFIVSYIYTNLTTIEAVN